jgi:MoaA/NifB/PqqE/SkfB family radical SAM enzyme
MIVVWRVTTRCNHSCRFCAYDQSLPLSRSNVDTEQVLRVGHLLADYQRNTGKPVLLSWLGGEPFLWKPMPQLTQELFDLGLRLSTTTNGSTLGNELHRAWAIAYLRELTISIDGAADTHDSVRGTAGGWLKLKSYIQRLSYERQEARSSLKLRVNTVLMRQNIYQFAEQCEEWASWGVQEITFNQLGGRDRPEFYPMHRLLPGDIAYLKAMLPQLRHRLALQGISLCGGDTYLDRMSRSAEGVAYPVVDCSPGQRFVFIDENGIASPCSFTTDQYGVPVSSWRDWQDVRDASQVWRDMQKQSVASPCSDCMATHLFEKFQS